MPKKLSVSLEIGKKKTFASAVDWPGWSRSGKDEALALQSLVDYGPRYGKILISAGLEFLPPADPAEAEIVERVEGNSTTDFGAPAMPLGDDSAPVGEAELERFHAILHACWGAFDRAAVASAGKQLRKGPRGGGRERAAIQWHVLEADRSYLAMLGWKAAPAETEDLEKEMSRVRKEILLGLNSSAAGELPRKGPRGGLRWSPRYFVRRVAWHVLDHAWELEDRIETAEKI
ncbi:MAG: hypothetical protein R3335_00065 [Anaerolineales bacterium]|nr:hypothetical protein [Anaerolineales bacterium]